MEWQATDQFGNLFVGESDAQSWEELRPHVRMLVEELRARAGEGFAVTVDFSYGEVNGPSPDQVSHIVQAPWLAGVDPATGLAELEALVAEACAEVGIQPVPVGRG